MNLRIFRTYHWARIDIPMESIRLGGPPEVKLVAKDELQFQNEKGEWVPVPVVEGEKPRYPY